MSNLPAYDEDLMRRLPMPLARLYRQAINAKTPLDRHQSAYYLWEAGIKLLGSTAIVAYAERSDHDPALNERLVNLARPSLGHWWEFVRSLVGYLAEHGVQGFEEIRQLILNDAARSDLPRLASLDTAFRRAVDEKAAARSTVRMPELFDRLIQYRNRELGHGATGQRSAEFYDVMGRGLIAAATELFARLSLTAGRQLVHVDDVRRQVSGHWGVDVLELQGEVARRLSLFEVLSTDAAQLPHPHRLYLKADVSSATNAGTGMLSLHPLMMYDEQADETLFINARRGRKRMEYLCYSSGRVVDFDATAVEQRELLAKVLDLPADASQVDDWIAAAEAAEPSEAASEGGDRRLIGDFELCSRLGQGGMGVVYRAVQPSLGRQVALKCLTHTGDKAEERFAREIQALGKVQHPNLIKVFTSGSDGDQFYYAMELVEGANLSTVCDRLQAQMHSASDVGLKTWQSAVSTVNEESHKTELPVGRATTAAKPSETTTVESVPQHAKTATDHSGAQRVDPQGYVRQVVDLVRQAAEATEALHKAGIVHRDIKPGNIMITADGSRAVLMDLGLAQFAEQGSAGKLTQTRQFVGTLRYASTEQIAAIDRLDGRTDVYSLGATLWELLTLKPMFGAGEQMATPELMKRIQFAEPEKIRKYNPAVPADLESVVLRCLEKNPAERYQTAHALAEDLQRWLDNKPVLAQPPSGIYRARKFARRHRKLLVAATLLIVLQAVVVAAVWKMQSPPQVLVDPNARAKALVRLAATANTLDMPPLVKFKVEMLKLRDRSDAEGVPLAASNGDKTETAHVVTAKASGGSAGSAPSSYKLSAGDWVAWRVTNLSNKPVDITMIFVDSQWEMTPIFPTRTALALDNRLASHESAMTRPARINDTTTGAEHVIVIGTPGVGATVDYRVLAGEHAILVPAPPESRGPDDPMTLGESSLTSLLKDTQTVADERGLDVDQAREYAMHLVTWTVDTSSASVQSP